VGPRREIAKFKLRHPAYIRYRVQCPGFHSNPDAFLVDSHSICSSYTHILFLEHRRSIRAQGSQMILFITIFGTYQPRLPPTIIFYLFFWSFCSKPRVPTFNIRKNSLIFVFGPFKPRHRIITASVLIQILPIIISKKHTYIFGRSGCRSFNFAEFENSESWLSVAPKIKCVRPLLTEI
jgi:hypothetical protein